MRSRLWSLILKELPSPFRQIGMEIAQIFGWVDQTTAKILVGVHRSPGWYFVSLAGGITLMLTMLLFIPYVASHDPTLGELAQEGGSAVRATRASLEAAGEWSAQDRWRVAHLFVDHRPPKKPKVVRLDSRLIEDPQAEAERKHGIDTEVSLELSTPRTAVDPQRFVADRFVREPGADFDPHRVGSEYRSRDPLVHVQAEWAFDPNCVNTDVVRRPMTRRPIPVPEPQWDEVRTDAPPVRVRTPDLLFELELLREFLPNTSEFPPRSRTIAEVAHSEFPPVQDDPLVSRSRKRSDHWLPSTGHVDHRPSPESYLSRIRTDDEPTAPFDDSEDDLASSMPSFAEMALRLELFVPNAGKAGHVHQSSIHLRNEGNEPVSLVRVREPLADLTTITDAHPDARVEHDSLVREIHQLNSGRDRHLDLKWLPNEEGEQTYRAAVTIYGAVGVTTNVAAKVTDPDVEPITHTEPEPEPEPEPVPVQAPQQHPSVKFEVVHGDRATVDDVVELEIVVRNTGDVPLSDVRILVDVPAELKHRQGSEVEYEVGQLPRNKEHRATLRMLAHSTGRANCQIRVISKEASAADQQVTIVIAAKPASLPASAPPKSPSPPKPTPMSATKPVAPKSNVSCCCPNLPVAVLWGSCAIP